MYKNQNVQSPQKTLYFENKELYIEKENDKLLFIGDYSKESKKKIHESRCINGKYYINSLPPSIHRHNIRLSLGKKWKDISDYVKNESNWKCSNCKTNMIENKQFLHSHEVWFFDYDNKTAEIIDIIPLCNYCHIYYHQGLYGVQRFKGEIDNDKAKIIEEHWEKYCSGGNEYKISESNIDKIHTIYNDKEWIVKPYDDLINKYNQLINKRSGQKSMMDF